MSCIMSMTEIHTFMLGSFEVILIYNCIHKMWPKSGSPIETNMCLHIGNSKLHSLNEL